MKKKENKCVCFFKNNSLSLVFAALFISCFIGSLFSGYYSQGQSKSLGNYFISGNFLEAILSNWQAAIMQLTALIIFGIFLRQKGSVHSRARQKPKRILKRRESFLKWIRENSFSLAFFIIFLITFILHYFAGMQQENEKRISQGKSFLSHGEFLSYPTFWFKTLQTWQAEYFAITLFVLLSIWLRQKDSPESKPTTAGDKETGEKNK